MNHIHATENMPTSLARMCAFFLALLAFLVVIGALVSADAQGARHLHRRSSQNNLLAEMQDDVKLIETQLEPKAKRSNVARNRAGNYIAFTLEFQLGGDEENTREVIFIEDKRLGKIYEVSGFDFPRPFADLAWKDNNTLVFDQWMQPHYLVHYALNIQQRKLVAAESFWERGYEP